VRHVRLSQLSKTEQSCGLCRMLLQSLNQVIAKDQENIVVSRDGSMLKMDGYEPPLLRISIGPGM
jgi:hypothetical protein